MATERAERIMALLRSRASGRLAHFMDAYRDALVAVVDEVLTEKAASRAIKLRSATGSKVKGGRYSWDPSRPTVFRIKFRENMRRLMESQGLRKFADFRFWKDPEALGDPYWLEIPVDKADNVADALENAGKAELAQAIRDAYVSWAAAGEAQAEPTPVPSTARSVELPIAKGELPSGARYEWDAQNPRDFLLLLPQTPAFALDEAQVPGRRAFRTRGGWTEYWRAYPVKEIPQIATVLASFGGEGAEDAAALQQLHERWAAQAPTLTASDRAARERQVIALMRRYRHMLDPAVRNDEARIARAMEEVVDLLGRVKPGDTKADLGGYGSWEVRESSSGAPTLVLRVDYNTQLQLDKLRGTRKGKDSHGWYRRVSLKLTPAAAKTLDRVGNTPLAMSLRIALLTDVNLGANCLTLEALSSAKALDEIPDLQARRAAVQVNRCLKRVLPPGLCPRPYQRVGIAFAYLSNYRALIADAPGLGKTIQAIGALLVDPGKALPAIIVAPASVVYNWQHEIEKWAPQFRPYVLDGQSLGPVGPRDVAIVSWGSLTRYVDQIVNRGFQVAIMDESHYAKHSRSQRSQAARELAMRIPGLLLLSGTPLENTPGDLWHQLHMLDPDQFPTRKQFMTRIKAGKRVVVTPSGTMIFDDDRNAENLEELRDMLRCVMVRRLKTDVLHDLPAKTREKVSMTFTPQEQRAYDAAEAKMANLLCARWREAATARALSLVAQGLPRAEAVAQVNAEPPDPDVAKLAIVRLGVLRRIAGELKAGFAAEWAIEFVQSTGEPLVVFVEHREVLGVIGQALTKAKIRWTYIDGSVPKRERAVRVAGFQRGDYDVIICTKAAREGITLTRASHTLFVERWWVPSWEEQAEDRIHRIGQKDSVVIHYLFAEGTTDEYIAALVDTKRAIQEEVYGAEVVALTAAEANRQERGLTSQMAAAVLSRLGQTGACRLTTADLDVPPDDERHV